MKNNMLRIFFMLLGLLTFIQVKSQVIEFGEKADAVKSLVEYLTETHNHTDEYGNKPNSYWKYDIEYNNGQIVDVIQCIQKEFIIDLDILADYCVHFKMQNGELSTILTEYKNVSLEKLKKSYSINYSENKMGELYFSDDYEQYSKIYLANNGLATVECRKTKLSELPLKIQPIVETKLTALRNEVQDDIEETIAQEENDSLERQYTILSCEDFSEGLALVCIDNEFKSGEMNYGHGDNLYGYINDKGDYAIPPQYQRATSFHDGFAIVAKDTRKSDYWEYINIIGENIFNQRFLEANDFSEGVAAVRILNEPAGFIDKNGEFISMPIYEDCGNFKEGMAKVKYQGLWGFVDKTGKEVIYPQFINAHDFSDGLAFVTKNPNHIQYSYIEKSGNLAFTLSTGSDRPTDYQDFSFRETKEQELGIPLSDFYEGLAIIENNKLGNVFIDKYGKVAVIPNDKRNQFRVEPFHFVNGYAVAKYNIYFGLLDKNGKWFVTPEFQDIGNFNEGLVKVELNDNWGFIDSTGNILINRDILKSKSEIITNPPFDAVSDFSEGLAVVQTRGKYGYINKLGCWVIDPELLDAKPFKDGRARVKFKDRKGWNYIDKTGKILFNKFL